MTSTEGVALVLGLGWSKNRGGEDGVRSGLGGGFQRRLPPLRCGLVISHAHLHAAKEDHGRGEEGLR
jgi:hypothetical protein